MATIRSPPPPVLTNCSHWSRFSLSHTCSCLSTPEHSTASAHPTSDFILYVSKLTPPECKDGFHKDMKRIQILYMDFNNHNTRLRNKLNIVVCNPFSHLYSKRKPSRQSFSSHSTDVQTNSESKLAISYPGNICVACSRSIGCLEYI